jgi:hypothetical protein
VGPPNKAAAAVDVASGEDKTAFVVFGASNAIVPIVKAVGSAAFATAAVATGATIAEVIPPVITPLAIFAVLIPVLTPFVINVIAGVLEVEAATAAGLINAVPIFVIKLFKLIKLVI